MEETKSHLLSDAARELIDLQAANEKVAKLMSDFLEKPTAADPASLRDFQRHQNSLVLQLILHQQKQIKSVHNALNKALSHSHETRLLVDSLLIVLKEHDIDPVETLRRLRQNSEGSDGQA